MRARRTLAALAAVLVASTAPLVVLPAGAEPTPSSAGLAPGAEAAAVDAAADLPAGSTAAPVNPTPTTLVQPDGTAFTAVPWGDGLAHGYRTEAGYTITRRTDGTWVYATSVRGTHLVASDRPATSTPPAGVARRLLPAPPTSTTSGTKTKATEGAATNSVPGDPHAGSARTVVILAQFTDQANVGTTAAQWASKYFGASSSVKDYYTKNSYDALTVTPATETSGTANDGVVGWVSLARTHPNSQPITDDVVSVAKSAIVAANPFINYGSFDTDGDGALSSHELHIVVITAGYEGAYGAGGPCGKAIWGHRSSFSTGASVDGVSVGAYDGDGGYMMFGEKHCDASNPGGTHMATIGIMVHEFGHDLGLPDLYPYGTEGGGAGEYSLMAYGSWLGNAATQGDTPSMLDPFSRLYEDWSVKTQIRGSGQAVSVPAAETSATVYQTLTNPYGLDWKSAISGDRVGMGEYYLIENRNKTGYDAFLPGCGILIWHINETRPTAWPNDSTTDFLVELEQADGYEDMNQGFNRGDDGDPFPGSSGNTSWGPATNPSSTLSNGAAGTTSVTVPAGACTASKSITVNAPAVDTPTNDSDAGSAPVALSGSTATYNGNSAGATAQGSDPVVPGTGGGASVWFTYTPASTGVLNLDTLGSSFDTTLGIYTRSGSATTTIASADDAVVGDPTAALYGVGVTAGTHYLIVLDGYDDGTRVGQGLYSLHLSLDTGVAPAPFGSFAELVRQQYLDLTGKAATTSQVNNWVSRIAAKPSDQYQLISDLRAGADNTGNVDPVARLYSAYFLRSPDPGGFRYWVGKKRSGSTVSAISNTFAGSSEFKNRYGSLSNGAFVNLVYQNVLGRAGEPSGVTFWTNQLNAGKKTRGQVMANFSESSEYKRISKPSIDLAVACLLLLQRKPNQMDQDYWLRQDALGRQSNIALARWVLALPEYEFLLGGD